MGQSTGRVILEPRLDRAEGRLMLAIDVANRSNQAIAIVTHPRYLILELADEQGLFVRGEAAADAPPSLVSAADYKTIAKNTVERDAFRLPIERTVGNACSIGLLRFRGIPAKTALRVIYKAEMMMPNLPKAQQQIFFRGPAEGGRTELDLTT